MLKRGKQFFATLLLTLALFACAAPQPIIDGTGPQAQAANAIAKAEMALTRGYRLVADQAVSGVLFKSELQSALTVLDQAAKLVDEAKALYDKGVFDGALDKVLDADKALDMVEAELAKKLKERRKP